MRWTSNEHDSNYEPDNDDASKDESTILLVPSTHLSDDNDSDDDDDNNGDLAQPLPGQSTGVNANDDNKDSSDTNKGNIEDGDDDEDDNSDNGDDAQPNARPVTNNICNEATPATASSGVGMAGISAGVGINAETVNKDEDTAGDKNSWSRRWINGMVCNSI
jgi:hypothetical protein